MYSRRLGTNMGLKQAFQSYVWIIINILITASLHSFDPKTACQPFLFSSEYHQFSNCYAQKNKKKCKKVQQEKIIIDYKNLYYLA